MILTDSDLRTRLNEMLREITVGEPLKSAFQPCWQFDSGWLAEDLVFSFSATSRNANQDLIPTREFINLRVEKVVKEHEARVFANDLKLLAHFVYSTLEQFLQHELMESFRVGGNYLYEPHPS